jgi:hypothetical protein
MNEEHKLTFDGTSATKLTYYYKPSYTYTTVNQSFYDADGTPTGTLQSWYPAMFAKIESGNATFKHLGGVICVKYPAMPAESGVFILKANNGKAITGKFDVDISSFSKDNPVKIETVDVPTSDNTNSYGNEVKITFSGASKGDPGVFYVPVPVGTYDVYLIMKSSDESSTLGTAYEGGVEISRQSLYGIILGNATITGNSSVQTLSGTDAASESGITNALGSNDAVVIDAAVTDPKIVIPETSSSSSDTETSKTVILNQVNSGSTITLSDGNTNTSDETKSVDNVTVSLPTSATATGSETVTAPSLTVTLPNTTVTVEANTGSTTIETATVETAENTFIVGSGVTINTLNVKKGNVILKSGSKVKAIAAAGNSNTVNVYYESDSSCPSGFTDGNSVYYAKRAGLTELKEAATAGGSLKLTENVTLDESLDISAALALDLNGYNLTVPTGKVLTISSSSVSTITLGEKSVLDVADNNGVAITGKAKIAGGAIKGTSPISITESGELKIEGTTVSDLSLLISESVLGTLSGKIKLEESLDISTLSVSGKKEITVDLNGKQVNVKPKYAGVMNLSAGTDFVKYENGTIKACYTAKSLTALNVYVGSLYLDNITFTAPYWHTAISAQNRDAYVNIKDSKVSSFYFGMSTNASTDGQNLVYGQDANIELENSTFDNPETGFMNNVPATVKMTGCTFSGNHQGALLRGGTYTIENCTFILKATLPLTDSECHNNSSWADGNRAAYAPIVIGNRSTSAYRYTTTVTFVGDANKGQISETSNTYASSFPAAYAWGVSGDAYKVTITGNMAGFRNSANYDFVYGGNVDVSGVTNPGNSQQASGTNGGEDVYVTGNF